MMLCVVKQAGPVPYGTGTGPVSAEPKIVLAQGEGHYYDTTSIGKIP